MRTLLSVLAVAAIVGSIGGAVSGDQTQSADHGSPVRLLPGYNHHRNLGVDTAVGRIWREKGPDIHYDVGLLAGDHAKGYVDDNPRVSLITVGSPATGDIEVAIDEKHDILVVSVDHYANFSARNVRSRKDVAEILLMANTVQRLPK